MVDPYTAFVGDKDNLPKRAPGNAGNAKNSESQGEGK
jgi:hypothetical protein